MTEATAKLETEAIKGSWEQALLTQSGNTTAKLKCVKEAIVATWNELLQADSPTTAEQAYYFHLVDNVATNEETNYKECIETIWTNVKLKAVENVAAPLVAYKWAMKYGDEAKQCTTLYDYALFLACQQSIEAFLMFHYEKFDSFMLKYAEQQELLAGGNPPSS